MDTDLVCLSRSLHHYAVMVHGTLQGISLDLMLAGGVYGKVWKNIRPRVNLQDVFDASVGFGLE